MTNSARSAALEDACGVVAAGLAKMSQIARHWAVHDDKARAILSAAGLRPADGGVDLYPWEVVWRLEGASYVPPSRHADYRAPMIPVEDLATESEADLRRGRRRHALVDLKPSALRARVAKTGAPVVRLGPRLQRVRPCDLPALLELLRAPSSKVRRRPATTGRTTPRRGG